MTRVAYLAIPHFSIAVERRERPRLAGQPLVIAGARQATTQVLDCSPEALAEGVRPGMPVGQAERLCPEAIFLPPRPQLYRQTTAALFELLSGALPAVEEAQPGGFYLGLAGLEKSDDEALLLCRRQSEAISRELRLPTTAGIAVNKFTAEAAALSIGPQRALALAAGVERSFLSRFPIDLLPVSAEMQRKLHLFGLRRMGQFARLPPAAVLAQFGWEGQRAQRLARGQDDRPITPGRNTRCEVVTQQFDPPLDNVETLAAVAARLTQQASSSLTRAFLRAGQLDLALTCADGALLAAQRILAEPTADADRLSRLAATLLRSLSYPDRVSELTVTLGDLSTPSLHQLSLWRDPRASEAEAYLARLAARYGPHCFRHARLVDPAQRLAARRFVLDT